MAEERRRIDAAGRLRRRLQHEARQRRSVERLVGEILRAHGIVPAVIAFSPGLPRLDGGQELPGPCAGDDGPKPAAPGDGSEGWPWRRPADPAPLRPPPGHACYAMADARVPVIGVVLFGMDAEAILGAVEMVAEAQEREASFIPLFVTDRPAFEIFRRFGYLAEIVEPDGGAGRVPPRDRLDLIRRQWQVERFVRLGPGGGDLLGEP
jgi:hypothetical protein